MSAQPTIDIRNFFLNYCQHIFGNIKEVTHLKLEFWLQ